MHAPAALLVGRSILCGPHETPAARTSMKDLAAELQHRGDRKRNHCIRHAEIQASLPALIRHRFTVLLISQLRECEQAIFHDENSLHRKAMEMGLMAKSLCNLFNQEETSPSGLNFLFIHA